MRSAVGSLPSLGLIKELQSHGIEVVGMDANPMSFGFAFLNKSYVIPYAEEAIFPYKITDIIRTEKPDAILLGPEMEIFQLAKYKKEIEKMGTKLLCPDLESVMTCINKLETYLYFTIKDIQTPKLYHKNDIAYPCIVKPSMGSGSKDVFKVWNLQKLEDVKRKIGFLPIIQEYIEGTEYSIDTLGDKDGNLICIGIRERIRVNNGISVIGKTVYDKEMVEYAKKIVRTLKLYGPSCIQCFKNEDGIFFIEINNRFGGGAILSIKANPKFIPYLKKIIKNEDCNPSLGFKEDLWMFRNYTEIFI